MKAQSCFSQYDAETGAFKASWSVGAESPFEAALMNSAANPGIESSGLVTGHASHAEARAAGMAEQQAALGLWGEWVATVAAVRGIEPFARQPGELGFEAAARELRELGLL